MRAEIEIKEITIDADKVYIASSYPAEGIYKVNSDPFKVTFILVNNSAVWVMGNFLPTYFKEIVKSESITLEKQEEKFSEEFILKLVAIAANKENYKNLIQPAFK